eukprot:6402950-Pyramimonas_sp.AAC.1
MVDVLVGMCQHTHLQGRPRPNTHLVVLHPSMRPAAAAYHRHSDPGHDVSPRSDGAVIRPVPEHHGSHRVGRITSIQFG